MNVSSSTGTMLSAVMAEFYYLRLITRLFTELTSYFCSLAGLDFR